MLLHLCCYHTDGIGFLLINNIKYTENRATKVNYINHLEPDDCSNFLLLSLENIQNIVSLSLIPNNDFLTLPIKRGFERDSRSASYFSLFRDIKERLVIY